MLVHQHRLANWTANNERSSKDGRKLYPKDKKAVTYSTTAFLTPKKTTRCVSDSASSKLRWWLVLPCILLITLASAPDGLIMNDFIVRRYERYHGLDFSEKAQRIACRESSTSTPGYWYLQQYSLTGADYNIVQQDAAKFNVKNSFATLIPSVLAIIILGSNCDTIGRRPLLFLPFVGKIVRYLLMLVIIAGDLSDTWLLVSHSCEALFGSVGIVMLSAFAYITDCTNESGRTRPFFLAELIILLARVVPVLGIGLWLQHHLYTIPTSSCLALSIIGALYVLFIQPESVPNM
ncbi:unnamed protein product [Rotaria socialis]|uniref:Major facilitator superfamily (MFS) profile domain-containing protein n=1 Tax=Rotaria socialis TaxID=392032 RepID=A0A818B4K7_9BILA|nr:unnamed protein product [Rotaria socialis]CAF3411885.1 unnamed protein product [Rotaria socialis]CAF3424558.1 unnamed protein product [Rotaria socialis]CAF4424184.1 unnamed protein product [Rotaria socialis]CAF4500356.1 unnamed protein product [Rotaria socialis]